LGVEETVKLIELEGIHKSYRQGGLFGGKKAVTVLKGVNLTVEAGRCLGLLGSSGCGKSTTGRLALGLEPPDQGRVLYKGLDLNRMNRAEKRLWRRNCQVVFQNSQGAVNPRHPAGRIIAEPLMNFDPNAKNSRAAAAELLKKVGLAESDLDKLPHQFSGGELQRVCIARALALRPEFILLDEAVSSLDMLSQGLVLDLLSELKRETGTAFLFISHDLRLLMKISDSLAVMDQGKITSFARDIEELETSALDYDSTLRALARAVLPSEPEAERSFCSGQ